MVSSPSQARQRETRARWLGTLKPDTLAKTEFKAKRVRDERKA